MSRPSSKNVFSPEWFSELEMLINRHSGLGIESDIASMTLGELLGLYKHLQRLES